jgi:putative transposase
MPRTSRENVISCSQVFHVINRGILRQEIFHDDQDVSCFLNIIRRYKEKIGFKVYHWCVMPNHYHLLMEFPDGSFLSKAIAACQQIYASLYHRKYSTAGRLFQNRFKSQAIEKQSYLFSCGRYIERNPVRAGLVKYPWEWKWSSACYYVSQQKDLISSVNEEFKGFYSDTERYKEWLSDTERSQEDEQIFLSSVAVIGSDNFQKNHIIQDGHAMIRRPGRPRTKKVVVT